MRFACLSGINANASYAMCQVVTLREHACALCMTRALLHALQMLCCLLSWWAAVHECLAVVAHAHAVHACYAACLLDVCTALLHDSVCLPCFYLQGCAAVRACPHDGMICIVLDCQDRLLANIGHCKPSKAQQGRQKLHCSEDNAHLSVCTEALPVHSLHRGWSCKAQNSSRAI